MRLAVMKAVLALAAAVMTRVLMRTAAAVMRVLIEGAQLFVLFVPDFAPFETCKERADWMCSWCKESAESMHSVRSVECAERM